MAGNPPADASQPSGMNGMMVTVPMNVAREPSAPRIPSLLFQKPNLTASVIGDSCHVADRRIAARTSRESPGERDDEPSAHRRDRVGDVPFGSDRRHLWVGNPGEWQIAGAA